MPGRRAIPCVFLALLLVQATGPFFVFEVRRHVAKKEMKRVLKERAPATMLRVIVLPATLKEQRQRGVRWIEDHEFRLDGCMYDVVRSMPHGDSIVYTCIEDERETILFAGLDALIRAHMNGDTAHKAAEVRMQRVLGQPYLTTAATVVADLIHIGMIPAGRAERAPEWTPRPASPPPKT